MNSYATSCTTYMDSYAVKSFANPVGAYNSQEIGNMPHLSGQFVNGHEQHHNGTNQHLANGYDIHQYGSRKSKKLKTSEYLIETLLKDCN